MSSRAFDGAGRIISETNPDDSTVVTTYGNDNGASAAITRTTNFGTVFEQQKFDGMGFIQSVEQNGILALYQIHDIDGHLTEQTAPLEGVHYYGWDGLGRRTSDRRVVAIGIDRGNGPVSTYDWDLDDRLSVITDGNGNATTYTRDGLGRIFRALDSAGHTSSLVYVPGSASVSSRALVNGDIETLQYDAAGQATNKTYVHLASPNVTTSRTFTYTALGQLKTATIDGSGVLTTLAYDGLGGLIKDSNNYSVAPSSVTNTFDPNGLTKISTVAVGKTNKASWTLKDNFDPLGRLQTIFLNAKTKPLVTFDNGGGPGGPLAIKYPSGAISSQSYDSLGRWTGLLQQTPDGKVQLSVQETLNASDGVARVRRRQYANGPVTADLFQVDLGGRLTAENFSLANIPAFDDTVTNYDVAPYMQGGPLWRSYVLDGDANWLTRSTASATQAATYDAINQISSFAGSPLPAYDTLGNVTAVNGSLVEQYPNNYYAGKPVSITVGSQQSTFVYDALDRRIAEISGTGSRKTTTTFVWEGGRLVARGSDSAGWTLEVPGQGTDQHIAAVDSSGATQYFYHQGNDNSVLGLTNANGKLVEGYAYTGFGEHWRIAPNGSSALGGASSVGNRFLYQGALLDGASGTYWMRAREYDPRFGRFMSRDPLGMTGGSNLYGFVGGNPLAYTDSFGLLPLPKSFTFTIDPPPGVEEAYQRLIGLAGNGGLSLLRKLPLPIAGSLSALLQDSATAALNYSTNYGTIDWSATGHALFDLGLVMAEVATGGAGTLLTVTEKTAAETGRVVSEGNMMSPGEMEDLSAAAQENAAMVHTAENDARAERARNTSVVVSVDADGNLAATSSSGANANLTPGQEVSEAASIEPTAIPGSADAHTEYKSLEASLANGDRPVAVGVFPSDFCPACRIIQSTGGVIVGVGTATTRPVATTKAGNRMTSREH